MAVAPFRLMQVFFFGFTYEDLPQYDDYVVRGHGDKLIVLICSNKNERGVDMLANPGQEGETQ